MRNAGEVNGTRLPAHAQAGRQAGNCARGQTNRRAGRRAGRQAQRGRAHRLHTPSNRITGRWSAAKYSSPGRPAALLAAGGADELLVPAPAAAAACATLRCCRRRSGRVGCCCCAGRAACSRAQHILRAAACDPEARVPRCVAGQAAATCSVAMAVWKGLLDAGKRSQGNADGIQVHTAERSACKWAPPPPPPRWAGRAPPPWRRHELRCFLCIASPVICQPSDALMLADSAIGYMAAHAHQGHGHRCAGRGRRLRRRRRQREQSPQRLEQSPRLNASRSNTHFLPGSHSSS